MDGKEINDLLTTLINKFEEIESFIDVMRSSGIRCTFTHDYTLFADSREIASELRVINSFARMSKESPHAKATMFIEAAKVLNCNLPDDKLESYVQDILDKKGKYGTNFRNFIANNVIESSRFKYLVRYGDIEKISKLAHNKKVLSFVLNDIPEAQILRYYNAGSPIAAPNFFPGMRDTLAEKLYNLAFTQF